MAFPRESGLSMFSMDMLCLWVKVFAMFRCVLVVQGGPFYDVSFRFCRFRLRCFCWVKVVWCSFLFGLCFFDIFNGVCNCVTV